MLLVSSIPFALQGASRIVLSESVSPTPPHGAPPVDEKPPSSELPAQKRQKQQDRTDMQKGQLLSSFVLSLNYCSLRLLFLTEKTEDKASADKKLTSSLSRWSNMAKLSSPPLSCSSCMVGRVKASARERRKETRTNKQANLEKSMRVLRNNKITLSLDSVDLSLDLDNTTLHKLWLGAVDHILQLSIDCFQRVMILPEQKENE